MNHKLKTIKLFLLFSLFSYGLCLNAQQEVVAPTIKVKKVEQLVKAEYDNTEYKLIGVDRFGNPKESAIRSFELYFTVNDKEYKFISYSNSLSTEMLEGLKQIKETQEIVFKNIKAADDKGTIVNLPELTVMHYPDLPKNKKKK